MALSPAEFLAPVGALDAALLFPGEDSAATGLRFSGYIARATTIVSTLAGADAATRERIARLYVVYLAYDSVVDRMALSPSSFSAADEGSVGWSSAQLKVMEKKRDDALAAYTDEVAVLGVAPPSDTQPSVSVRHIMRF
jgi:hypothetical protein